ncbi:PREDICTED: uncharacterized protein LOC109350521 [Lupinus angustifolius]|uniref:uncharacterized protein LOC109350521 n=1 Tax=Lupinus angustifolius TaxID=3871 RepID=UPI00092E33D4|nr:PREDICTED: uncharacterized protein LOC109350521 [Lupinus angustifolius]
MKLEEVDGSLCFSVWGNNNCSWDFNPAVGRSGGILSIWDDSKFHRTSSIRGSGYLAVFGIWLGNSAKCCLVNIYSPCQLSQKRQLWEELIILRRSVVGVLWCFLGDFNAVRDGSERSGIAFRVDQWELCLFNEWIRGMDLVDLPLIGIKFTWVQSGGGCMSRLDMFLLSAEWIDNWEGVFQWALPRSFSDHCLILLKYKLIKRGPNPFKFNNCWLNHKEFKGFIQNSWGGLSVVGWHAFVIKEKLRLLKGQIKMWNKSHFGDLDSQILLKANDIHSLDLIAEDWWRLSSLRENLLIKKSKANWLKEGDANSKFFYACMKNRSRRNRVFGLSFHGQWLEEDGLVRKGVVDYFKEVFKGDSVIRPTLDEILFNSLSSDKVLAISEEFSLAEIKAAVWNCAADKSPSPDGFNFKFFQDCWDIVGSDICCFMQDFFLNAKITVGLNASFIALILKISSPTRIQDFRAISLISSLYKILSKVLASRLKMHLGLFEGYRLGRNHVEVSNLQYADDTVLVRNPTIQNLWCIRSIVRCFELVSGLKVNALKSALFGVKVDLSFLSVASHFLSYSIGTFPFKYLGIPTGSSPRNSSTWVSVIEAVANRLNSWRRKFISFGGRVVLLNVVLANIPIYLLSLFKAPKKVILSLVKIQRRFLWGNKNGGKGVAWVSWVEVCKPKSLGGLGVKDIQAFNLALLGKWKCRFLVESESLWARVIRSKYGDSLPAHISFVSFWWKNVDKVGKGDVLTRNWFHQNVFKCIGDGACTNFWTDVWVGNVTLTDSFPRLFSIALNKHALISYCGFWLNDSWNWKVVWRRIIFVWEDELQRNLLYVISQVGCKEGGLDIWSYRLTMSGSFDVQSAYTVALNLAPFDYSSLLDKAWIGCCPSKDVQHLFWTCAFSAAVWDEFYAWTSFTVDVSGAAHQSRVVTAPSGCSRDALRWHIDCCRIAKASKWWRILWFTVVWSILLLRNEVVPLVL